MLGRVTFGDVPPKHHTALRGPDGALRHEECLTRAGFDGPYSILYHLRPPHRMSSGPAGPEGRPLVAAAPGALRRRHFRTERAVESGTREGRVALLFNEDLTLGILRPNESAAAYYSVNADGDEVFFVRSGQGVVRSPFGDLDYRALDYVIVPRGVPYRLIVEPKETQEYLFIELAHGVEIPRQWRNEVGQLRMDAPYCHRDFRIPELPAPRDEGIRDVLVKRGNVYHSFTLESSPLDVVGWDGAVYPWAISILAFQPRVGLVHLPPTWHGTFASPGALICSFVPRPLDFHPDAIPCPYPHSSVDVDEVLYYVAGDFTSRSGVGPGSITVHPRGIPHGPQPGRYEASIGKKHTDEVAVMLDCYAPLRFTEAAVALEDPGYEAGFGSAG